jgi:hypothetical protein
MGMRGVIHKWKRWFRMALELSGAIERRVDCEDKDLACGLRFAAWPAAEAHAAAIWCLHLRAGLRNWMSETAQRDSRLPKVRRKCATAGWEG